MWTALWIVFWLFAGLIVLLAAFLLTPVKFRLIFQSAPEPDFRLDIRAFGGLTPSLRVVDTERKRSGKKAKKEKPKKEKKPSEKKPFSRFSRGLKAAPDLIAGLLRTIRFEKLHIDGEFGLGDPAATGELYGRLTPLIYGTAGSRTVSVSLRPDFQRACLSGEADAVLSLTPAALVPPVIRFAWRAFGP